MSVSFQSNRREPFLLGHSDDSFHVFCEILLSEPKSSLAVVNCLSTKRVLLCCSSLTE